MGKDGLEGRWKYALINEWQMLRDEHTDGGPEAGGSARDGSWRSHLKLRVKSDPGRPTGISPLEVARRETQARGHFYWERKNDEQVLHTVVHLCFLLEPPPARTEAQSPRGSGVSDRTRRPRDKCLVANGLD
ncbi:uncharacterized protein JN550_007608 [Neoarthrinium moseri]|uniref:uncharacterized protein n=1 Tax=Neoarthrinium moseri TaxID=1658444 RepID=UPI001FDD76CA|nr:uncharacterized protein JN550_007608 [Neoarthrinium moseri]KAI1866755.1 hypothetical protein JN550_007608 [Neoarthrinium moseri]